MKIRSGFVSNSSSSSFVIAYTPGDKCPMCGRGADFSDEFNRNGDIFAEGTLHALGKEEVLDRWLDINSGGYSAKEIIAFLDKLYAAIADGKQVMYVDIPYGDDDLMRRITEECDVIESW